MLVQKRNGSFETYQRHKVTKRIEMSCFGVDPKQINIQRLLDDIDLRIYGGITTIRINEFIIEAAVRAMSINPVYVWIAGHVEVDNMHRSIAPPFSVSVAKMREGPGKTVLSQEFLNVVDKHHKELDSAILHLRDYSLPYDTIKDYQDRFLGRKDSQLVERIQHMFMRMAVAIHLDDIPNVLATYELLSSRRVVHDTFLPRYAGTTERFLTSSYSLSLTNCDAHDVHDAVGKAVFAARRGATVGITAHAVYCSGRNTTCDHEEHNIGLWTLMKYMEGALALARRSLDARTDMINVCLPVWHVDVRGFLEFNNLHQHDLSDQKGLTITCSLPDLFVARVEDDGYWSLFCPKDVPDLLKVGGRDFDVAYARYESSGTPSVRLRAKELWGMMMRSLILTGGPSIVFQDNVNGKSNITDMYPSCQADLRTGMVDNLGDEDELYPRNHASLALPLFVTHDGRIDYMALHHVAKETTYNLNRILDATMPYLASLLDNNREFRSIGLGIHGLADVFTALRIPYDSLEAFDINERIAETIYHGALEASCDLAEKDGPYEAFYRSPMAEAIMQYDFWGVKPSGTYDWDALATRIRTSGVRNASLIAIGRMTDAERSSGFTESTEPPRSNLLENDVVCPWLVQELVSLDLWDDEMHDRIVAAKGSIQQIPSVPQHVKAIYRTAWEIDPDNIIKMALGRAPFVCNNQSINLYLESPNIDHLGELLIRSWSYGLKSGVHRVFTRFLGHSDSGTSYDGTDREMSFDEVILSSSSS